MNDKINSIMDAASSRGESIGALCLVLKGDDELFFGANGHADRAGGVAMKRDNIFRLFSLSKPITAAAVMLLTDMGKLSPSDPVSKYFPEYSDMYQLSDDGKIVPCADKVTILHLLTMTSGIPYANVGDPSVEAAGKLFDQIIEGQQNGMPLSTEGFCRRAAGIPLRFAPGSKWDYGISADILGGICEQASGMRFSQFLRKYLFDPLGMNDTGFYVPQEKISRFTKLYSWQKNGLGEDHGNYLGLTDYSAPPAFESGGAGLVSTIDDYARFVRMLTGGGVFEGKHILSSDAVRFMAEPKLGETQQACLWDRLSGYNYGCLMRVMTRPEKSDIRTCKGEFGWDGWTGTYFCADISNRIAVLYFTQICGAGTTSQAAEISSVVYDELIRGI